MTLKQEVFFIILNNFHKFFPLILKRPKHHLAVNFPFFLQVKVVLNVFSQSDRSLNRDVFFLKVFIS